MSAALKRVWTRAEAISANRLMTITLLESGDGYLARFPADAETQSILMPHIGAVEEVTVTVQRVYGCPMEASLAAQSDHVHADLCRLLDRDSTTDVECAGFRTRHIAPEAETYSNIARDNVPAIQADRINGALSALYTDAQCAGEKLRDALCDLRHFADANGLDFTLADQTATAHYAAETST